MKRFISILFLAVVSILAISVQGQSISTVGEIYDYEVGDIFHFQEVANGFGSVTNIHIADLYYSQNLDTIFYVRDVAYKQHTEYNPYWIFDYYTDTIFYTELDSLINSGNIDTVYTDESLYNGRKINSIYISTSNFNWVKKFVIGCGQAYERHHGWDGSGGYYILNDELVFYSKGDDIWGIPEPVSIEDKEVMAANILVFPNPTKNYIYIKQSIPNFFYTLELQDLHGQLVRKEKDIQSSDYTMNVSDLKPGIYFYVIKKKGEIVQQGKLIKK